MLSIDTMTREVSDPESSSDITEKLFDILGNHDRKWREKQTDAFVASNIGCLPWARTADHHLNSKLMIHKRHIPWLQSLSSNEVTGFQYEEVLNEVYDSDEEVDGSSMSTTSDSDSGDDSSEDSTDSKMWEIDSEGIPIPIEGFSFDEYARIPRHHGFSNGKLPMELVQMIHVHLDLQSLSRLSRVSRADKELVDNLLEYKRILSLAPYLASALVGLGVVQQFSVREINHVLYTTKCSDSGHGCSSNRKKNCPINCTPRFGAFISLRSMKRFCERCWLVKDNPIYVKVDDVLSAINYPDCPGEIITKLHLLKWGLSTKHPKVLDDYEVINITDLYNLTSSQYTENIRFRQWRSSMVTWQCEMTKWDHGSTSIRTIFFPVQLDIVTAPVYVHLHPPQGGLYCIGCEFEFHKQRRILRFDPLQRWMLATRFERSRDELWEHAKKCEHFKEWCKKGQTCCEGMSSTCMVKKRHQRLLRT